MSKKGKGLSKKAVEAIQERYSCKNMFKREGQSLGEECCSFGDCRFGNGNATSSEALGCWADEFYEGYMQALKDNKE